MPDTDYDALLEDGPEYADNADALGEVLDNTHLGAPVTAALEDEQKSLTDAEIEAQTDDLGPEDLERAIGTRTPEMRALLQAKDGGKA